MTNDNPVPPATPQANISWFRALRQRVVFGLLVFSLLTFALALILIAASVRNDIGLAEANLNALQDDIIRLSTPSAEVQALTTTLSDTRALANQLEAAAPPVGANWPTVIAVIDRYDPAAITLISLIQTDNRITLSGQAINDAVVVDYEKLLRESGLFNSVVLQSLKLATPAESDAAATAEAVEFVITIELSV